MLSLLRAKNIIRLEPDSSEVKEYQDSDFVQESISNTPLDPVVMPNLDLSPAPVAQVACPAFPACLASYFLGQVSCDRILTQTRNRQE